MTEYKEQTNIINRLKPGDRITAFFVVRKKELKTKKDGSPYLLLGLGDATGRISATFWNDVQRIHDAFRQGDTVKVRGTVMSYKDTLQLSVQQIRKAESADKVDPNVFIPRGEIDVKRLSERLFKTIQSVKNPHLHMLLKYIFNDSHWYDLFIEAPGGKLWHHAYKGGLLEHTMAVVETCETMARIYPMAHRDLLITGALLHDMGKIEEYGYDRGFIDFTDEGRLWGHISIGGQHIRALIENIEKENGFSQELKKQLIHLILSHQGELEHGSPVLPQTLEAMILYYADEMDSKANALKHIIERDSKPGRTWSQYINLLDRFIYLGNSVSSDGNSTTSTTDTSER